MSNTLMIGDARLDRVVDLEGFPIALTTLFPTADAAALAGHLDWLEPNFMRGEDVILSIHSTVLRVAGRVILVDSCVGEHKPRPRHPLWHERAGTAYLSQLAALGLAPEDVDIVFCTHLHADHVGWNTKLRDGRWVPTFPKARYLIGRAELAHWLANGPDDPMVNHGAFKDSVLPVIESRQVDEVDGEAELLEGLTVRPLPGHSPGQVGLSLHRCGERGLLCGDAVHHPVQLLKPEWSSRFCHDPTQAEATRRALLADVADQQAWLIPAHFRRVVGMQIQRVGDGFLPK